MLPKDLAILSIFLFTLGPAGVVAHGTGYWILGNFCMANRFKAPKSLRDTLSYCKGNNHLMPLIGVAFKYILRALVSQFQPTSQPTFNTRFPIRPSVAWPGLSKRASHPTFLIVHTVTPYY